MNPQNHPYHLVTASPWPIIMSVSLFNSLIYTTAILQSLNYSLFFPLTGVFLCMLQWWRDVIREATFQGCHTKKVFKGMRLGMILFILSEVLFFFSFFWAYFHSSLAPNMEIGQYWPPSGITPFNPFDIPLLNTIILVSSGMTITWSHHAILNKTMKESNNSLMMTIILGLYFTILQEIEYQEAPFTMADSIYGATFFIATGFHGLHVIIGTLFLTTMFLRMNQNHFSSAHHFGFEAAAWYWHFVDVVWLFLYLSIYWWSY